jgi:hypothetical protein
MIWNMLHAGTTKAVGWLVGWMAKKDPSREAVEKQQQQTARAPVPRVTD